MAVNAAYSMNAQPARKPQQRPTPKRPEFRPVKQPQKSSEQIKREQRETAFFTAKICAFALVLVAIFGVMLYSKFQLNALMVETQRMQNKLEIAQNESVRMNMESYSKVSLDKVEEYAVMRLGMVKQDSRQVEYVKIEDEKIAEADKGKQDGLSADKKASANSKN